ncbi:unnamed protein product [Caenorhabditis sp. 36 PRJEB53466]|nr:unnamed protein product [Caenorhabditis sp. 36 PRJEB53466]
MASTPGVLVDDNVLEVLRKAQLDAFVNKFVFQFNVRRFDHFSHVRDKDMQEIGMQQQQIRQLREQILKMSREMWNRSDPKQVYVQSDQSTPIQSTIDERALIPNEQIKLYELIGEGSFAVVKRGTWTQSSGQTTDVAVKILRDISPNIMDDLRVEASHLLKLQHPSLIRLYGIVRQPAMMVFERCEGGSLLDRLRDDKKPIPLVSRLHDYCMQIAKALQFLESKHCVHRDVAARNILLSKDEKIVKICDFGLMRALKENEQMYTMAPQKKVPFAWCPPEALRHRKFSHASDVWSYGITIWEIFTFGEEPWVGCRAIDVLKNMDAGERLEKPKYCSERLYQIMQNCWKSNPAERCKFGAIREDLKAAMFLEAVAREAYNSIQPGTLQLIKGDEVIVVENTGQDWFGQNKKNQHFGTFPRTAVFAQSNHAVAATTAVTPQKVPTAPTIKVPPQQVIQPPPLPFAPKPLNNNSITSVHDRGSRISMPVAGSFIHTGHGDPLGGQSWGNPSSIDQMYLKNPVKGVPLSSMSNGAEVIASKVQLTNGGRNTHVPAASSASAASITSVRGLSLDLPEFDDFDRAFDDSFSPSNIEFPRGFGNESMISHVSNGSTASTFLLDGPKPNDHVFDVRGNVLHPTPIEKIPSATLKPILVAPSSIGVVTMELPDKFTIPQPHSSIGINRTAADPMRVQPRHNNSAGSRLDSMGSTATPRLSDMKPFVIDTRQNNQNFLPELQNRLDLGNDVGNAMRPRPASSIGIQNNGITQIGGNIQRPFSVINTPTVIPCLVPTPAPISSINPTPNQKVLTNQANPLQKALTDELKGNLSRRPTSTSAANESTAPQGQRNVLLPQQYPFNPTTTSQKPFQPQQVRLPLPTTSSPSVSRPVLSQTQPAAAPYVPPAHHVPRATAAPIPAPTVVPTATSAAATAPPKKAPTPVVISQQTAASSASVVTRRPTPTNPPMSEEERKSKIIMEINSALPAPSSLLFGSNSTSSLPSVLPSAPSTSTVRDRPTIAPSQPQRTMPPKKTSEPILSTEVLQPTRLNTTPASVAHSVAQPIRNPSPPVVNNKQPVLAEKKIAAPTATTNVPLFNITNSSNMYPQLGGVPNYGNGYTPYGYGTNYYGGGYQAYQGYNPYLSGMGQLALTHSAVTSLPPLVPSENRFSGTAQPLGESDIIELLGQQNRPPAAPSGQEQNPARIRSAPSAAPGDVSMAEKMEVLYKEANFTKSGNCDTMVMNCNGDTELALKMLKQQHLVDMGVADSTDRARRALESHQYDLTAAVNFLLG